MGTPFRPGLWLRDAYAEAAATAAPDDPITSSARLDRARCRSR